MKWYWLQFAAWVRGRLHRWPSMPAIPGGFTGVSCGLRGWREAREMYSEGWIPWSVQTTRDGSPSRLFIVKDDHPAPPWEPGPPPGERGEAGDDPQARRDEIREQHDEWGR